jgi:hypothetical protein
MVRVQFVTETATFLFTTMPRTQSAFYTMGTSSSFLGVKVAGA